MGRQDAKERREEGHKRCAKSEEPTRFSSGVCPHLKGQRNMIASRKNMQKPRAKLAAFIADDFASNRIGCLTWRSWGQLLGAERELSSIPTSPNHMALSRCLVPAHTCHEVPLTPSKAVCVCVCSRTVTSKLKSCLAVHCLARGSCRLEIRSL